MQETWVGSPCWEDPLEKEMATHSNTVNLENPMDRGAWRATIHGVAKEADMTEMTACTHGDSVVKIFPANAGDVGSVPGSGRFPGEGNDNPLQYSCLGNPMYRGAWWVAKSDMT